MHGQAAEKCECLFVGVSRSYELTLNAKGRTPRQLDKIGVHTNRYLSKQHRCCVSSGVEELA